MRERIDIVCWRLVEAGFALAALLYYAMPDRVPICWDWRAQAGDFLSKPWAPFLPPSLMLAAQAILARRAAMSQVRLAAMALMLLVTSLVLFAWASVPHDWELIASSTAARLHLDNTPGPAERDALDLLSRHVLDPIRREFGPIRVNSGYRSSAVNSRCGGVANSQHLFGEAADIRPLNAELTRVFEWVRDHLDYDQVILEGNRWLHVSFTAKRPNRRRAFAARLPGRR